MCQYLLKHKIGINQYFNWYPTSHVPSFSKFRGSHSPILIPRRAKLKETGKYANYRRLRHSVSERSGPVGVLITHCLILRIQCSRPVVSALHCCNSSNVARPLYCYRRFFVSHHHRDTYASTTFAKWRRITHVEACEYRRGRMLLTNGPGDSRFFAVSHSTKNWCH